MFQPLWEKVFLTGVPFYRLRTTKIIFLHIIQRVLSIPPFSWLKPFAQKVYQSVFTKDDYANLGKKRFLKKTFQNIVEECPSAYLDHLKNKKNILLIWGEKDQSAGTYENAQRVHKEYKIPLHVIPKGNHFPWVDDPKSFTKILFQ